jgi:nucleotide-binding universal stress UspA family protein
VAQAIVALAEQHDADLIVVGSKGMQGAGALLRSIFQPRLAHEPVRRADLATT